MDFLDREKELALLADHLERPEASLFVLYGRRRIGKTELLRRAIAGRPRATWPPARLVRRRVSGRWAQAGICGRVEVDGASCGPFRPRGVQEEGGQ